MDVRWLTAFLDRPAGTRDTAAEFWTRVTGSALSPLRGARAEFATLLPPDGDPYLRLQTVLDGGAGTHLDLHVKDVAAAVDRAVALGARARQRDGYAALTSPAGLPWCLVPADPDPPRRPTPLHREDGSTVLLDQVCLDVPPSGYEAEGAFWAELTGWELRPGSRPEFGYLVRPAGIPLRILLQRLDTPPADGRAGCHPDLACTDVAAETARHEGLGARVLARFPNWTTLADPSGAPYCLTRRDPATGTLPG